MRKAAGLKRGSRKSKQQSGSEDTSSKSPTNSGDSSTNGEQRRKQPSTEEAALTSKNYRLAKELSELRVRHRDETKNVTRLTMENMNLASRCREAISHVAMLKKELAMHQKRASEALAMQRQSQSANHSESGVLSELSDLARPSQNNAPSSTSVAVEMDRMDKLMATHAPPPPPPPPPPTAAAAALKENEDKDDSPRSSVSPSSSRSSEEDENTTVAAAPIFPHSASPKQPKHRSNYNDDYPGDVAPHKASHESSLPSVQDEEEESSSAMSEPATSSQARQVANMKLSSIDAFEASFDTAFPSSFASTKEGEQAVTTEIYNPFFSSPQKRGTTLNRDENVGNKSPGKGKWGTRVRDRSSPAVLSSPTNRLSSGANETLHDAAKSSGNKQPMIYENGEQDGGDPYDRSPEREAESSRRMPDPSSSPKIVSRASGSYGAAAEPYRTPPHFQQKGEVEKPAEDQPRRPEKTVTASARARYEKALQPRGYHSRIKDPISSGIQAETSLDSSEQARNSPGTVLRRLQQRRAKSDRFQQNLEANSTPIPGMETKRTSRPLPHPPVLPSDPESPFDEEKKSDRRGSGQNMASQSGSYRNSQNESENSNYQRSSRSQTNPAAKKLSPDSMNAEIRALDAMAGSYQKPGGESPAGNDLSPNSGSSSSSSRYAALKQRRSVKQPISYAEPNKMRRGDGYVERSKSEDGNSSPNPVSPTSSSPEDVSGSRRARTRAGASPNEVLKDLGATVRS
jgi:predicted transcriptional regulator